MLLIPNCDDGTDKNMLEVMMKIYGLQCHVSNKEFVPENLTGNV